MTPAELQQLLAQAQAHHRAGRFAEAEGAYLRLAQALPGNADLWHAAGVAAYQRADPATAIERYGRALAINPTMVQAHNNLGLALKRAGRREEAASSFAAALAAQPGYAEAAFNLAILREESGALAEAEAAYRAALAARPDWTAALENLGNLLRSQRRPDEAQPFLQRAAQLDGGNADTAGNLALLRIDQGRLAEARELAARAIAAAPETAAWHEAAGTAARLMGDFDAAAMHLARAHGLDPRDAALAYELGLALEACADDEGARRAFAQARALAPAWERLRWSEAFLLPRVPRDDAEIAAALKRFDACIEAIESDPRLGTGAQREAALDAATSVMPFNLHYLPGDHTARQCRYGDLVARAARAALPDFAHPLASRRGGGRIRVGFVGSHVREHVVMRYFADFMVKLDAARFERFVWSASEARDCVTEEMAASVEHLACGESTLAKLANDIRAAALDVLVFLDAGLDPRMTSLAALRLAPVQAALYGHPVTTGLDSVDFFLGGELLETARSDAHYRERLVRLPGLGASIRPGPTPGDGRWAEALREDGRPLLMCLQNLAKIPPSFDAVLAQVAAQTRAPIVFFNRGPALTARFISRVSSALDARGLSPAAIHVEPLRPHADYLAGIARASLVLDVPGFSGGATSLDALSVGTPIVAFEGEMARARQSSAMLRRIGLEGLVARDDRDYIDKVLTSVASPADRRDVRARAARLFGDDRCVAGFADFLRDAGRGR